MVLGANDGIISIAGVVIGVASATHNIWIIFFICLSVILAGAFSTAGGEYVSFHTKDTEEAAVNHEQFLIDRDPKLARESLPRLLQMENAKLPQSGQSGPSEISPKALVEEKYGIEYEEFTNPGSLAFSVGSLPPMLDHSLPTAYRIPVTVFCCWTISDLHWLYQCETGEKTKLASHASQPHHWPSHHGCDILLRATL